MAVRQHGGHFNESSGDGKIIRVGAADARWHPHRKLVGCHGRRRWRGSNREANWWDCVGGRQALAEHRRGRVADAAECRMLAGQGGAHDQLDLNHVETAAREVPCCRGVCTWTETLERVAGFGDVALGSLDGPRGAGVEPNASTFAPEYL